MGVTVATTRTTCNVAVGNQDITTADLGDLTPVGVWLTIVRATSDGVASAHAVIGVGAATDTDERWAISGNSEDNVATTDTARRGMTDECVVLLLEDGSGNVDGEADFISFIANGVRINWGNAPASAYLIEATFFAGTDVSAHAGTFTMPAVQNNTVDVNTVGFEPDTLLLGSIGSSFNDIATASNRISAGTAINDGSDTQCSWGFNSRNNVAATEVTARIDDSYGVMEVGSGSLTWGCEINTFDANGFSATTRAGAGSGDVGYLALAFNGVVSFNAGIIDSPTANGNNSWNEPGFEPQAVFLGLTQLTAIDTDTTTGDAGSIGLSVFDEDDEYCFSIQDEDAEATTDTQSLSDDTAVNLPNDDGSVSWVASFVSFDASGWTLNFTQSEGTAVKWWYLAIGAVEVVPTVTTITPPRLARNLMYIEQVTFREPYGLQLIGGDDERLEIFLAQRGLPGV